MLPDHDLEITRAGVTHVATGLRFDPQWGIVYFQSQHGDDWAAVTLSLLPYLIQVLTEEYGSLDRWINEGGADVSR